jgi:hypothetical protein
MNGSLTNLCLYETEAQNYADSTAIYLVFIRSLALPNCCAFYTELDGLARVSHNILYDAWKYQY